MSVAPAPVRFLITATIAVLCSAAMAKAAESQPAGAADAVHRADLIVRGKVTRRLPEIGDNLPYGLLEVSEVIYGSGKIQRLTLVLRYTSEDVTCDLGDEGVFFLRAKPPGGPQQLMVGPTRGSPEHMAQLPFTGAFIAAGHDACWAENDAFYARNPSAVKPDPATAAARRRAMYEGVHKRLADEAAELRAVLDRNAENAARAEAALRAMTTTPATKEAPPATAPALTPSDQAAAADVSLIGAWLTGADASAAERPFGDARSITGAGDPIYYTDVEHVMLKGLRPVPYEFIKPRMELLRGGHHASPAVLITRTVAEEPQEGPLVRQAEVVRKNHPHERYYYVEVAIGNLAWHWMKLGVYEEEGKPRIEVLRAEVS